MDFLNNNILNVAILGGAVTVVLQLLKQFVKIEGKYIPFVAVIVGMLAGMVVFVGFPELMPSGIENLVSATISGAISGLVSIGIYQIPAQLSKKSGDVPVIPSEVTKDEEK